MRKRSLIATIALMLLFIVPTYAGNTDVQKEKPDLPNAVIKTQDLTDYELQANAVIAQAQVIDAMFDKGYVSVRVDSSIETELSAPYVAEKPSGEKVGGIIIHNYISLVDLKQKTIDKNIKENKSTTLPELAADKAYLQPETEY